MDLLSFIGIAVSLLAILGGQMLEGGHLASLVNGPAVVIVFGGTIGAILLQAPLPVVQLGLRRLAWVFFPPRVAFEETIERIVEWSNTARREGLLGLDALVDTEEHAFTRKGLQLLVDGNEPGQIRKVLEVEISTREQLGLQAARLYEAMGGYAPTIGILGAVLGLIHVMENLADPSRLGSGIAAAFVATVYGVGSANLLYLPLANKLKNINQTEVRFAEMVVDGIAAIAEGDNPRNIRIKLEGYLG